jgi:hypothetical protein
MRLTYLCVLALLAVACGDDDDEQASGGSGGAGLTMGVGGAGAAGGGDDTTRIEVMDEIGMPVAGVPVFVHDAAGAVLNEHTSDDTGVVDLPLMAGQWVSVAWVEYDIWETQRVDTVPATPGEDLRFTVARTKERTNVQLTFNNTNAVQGFWNAWSCGPNVGNPIQSGVVGVCPGSETFDVVVYATVGAVAGAGRQVFAGLSSLDGMSYPIDVDAAQIESTPRVPVIANSAPPNAIVGAIMRAYRPGGGYNWMDSQPVGNEVSMRRLYAPAGSHVEEIGRLTLTASQYRQVTWRDAVPDNVTIDPIVLADVTTTSSDGALPPTISWELGSGEIGDAVRVDVRWDWSDVPYSYKLLWRVYAAADGATLSFPQLPIALTANPTLTAPDQVTVYHIDVDGIGGVSAAANARSDRATQRWFQRTSL